MYVKWDHITTPFGIADRDFVFKVRIEFKAKEKQMIVSFHSVKDSAAPRPITSAVSSSTGAAC